jgi:hypothetical protein
MVCAWIVGIGIHQRRKPQAIELQPRHDDGEQIVFEAEVKRWRQMGTARLKIPVSKFNRKPLACLFANPRSLLTGVIIELEVGMVALDVRVRASLFRKTVLCSRP